MLTLHPKDSLYSGVQRVKFRLHCKQEKLFFLHQQDGREAVMAAPADTDISGTLYVIFPHVLTTLES